MDHHLRLVVLGEQDVGGLDVAVDDPARAPLVEVPQPPCGADRDPVAPLPRHRRQLLVVEVGGDGAARGELEDEVEAAVDAAAQQRGHVGVAHVPHRAQLRQKVLLLLLVRRRQPLHRDGAAVVQGPAVHLAVPALPRHVVCSRARLCVSKEIEGSLIEEGENWACN
jgi:hypothetical protein